MIVSVVRHGARDEAPAAPGGLPLRSALRCVRAHYNVLKILRTSVKINYQETRYQIADAGYLFSK